MYYRQDNRSYVGNSVLWWRIGGGYTTNLLEAEIFKTELTADESAICSIKGGVDVIREFYGKGHA